MHIRNKEVHLYKQPHTIMSTITVQRKGYKEEYIKREGPLFTYRTTLNPGVSGVSHLHKVNQETILVISGQGILHLGNREIEIGPGDKHVIDPGVLHKIKNSKKTGEPLVLEQTKKCIRCRDFFIAA